MAEAVTWHHLHEDYDEDLTLRFYTELIIPSFPIPDELEDVSVWVEELTRSSPADDAAFFLTIVTDPNGTIQGGIVFEYYLTSRCALLSYIVVHPSSRSRGLGRKLLAKAVEVVNAAAQRHGHVKCEAVFVETNIKGVNDGVMDSEARHALFHRWGFAQVKFPYVQPALTLDKLPCRDLLLLMLVAEKEKENEKESVEKEVVVAFMHDFWGAMYEDWEYAAVPVFQGMVSSCNGCANGLELRRELPWVQEDLGNGAASVVVIGGGIAGLTAALGLERYGYAVQVVEASHRIGGRVWTEKTYGVELGASFVHGENSSIAQLAKREGWQLEETFDVEEGYRAGWVSEGKIIPMDDISEATQLDHVYAAASELLKGDTRSMDAFMQSCEASERCVRMASTLWANTEGANLEQLGAAAYVDQSERWRDGSKNYRLAKGYQVLVDYYLANGAYPVVLGKEVVSVALKEDTGLQQGSKGVAVRCQDGSEMECDFVVCTVPLSVLKAGSIEFAPELSPRKRRSIQQLGFGVVTKLVLVLQRHVEFVRGQEEDAMDILLWTDEDCIASQVWTKRLNAGLGLVVGFVVGNKAHEAYSCSEDRVLERFLQQLSLVLHDEKPLASLVQAFSVVHWADIEGVAGGYSFPTPDCSTETRSYLAAPELSSRVFFAGEATSTTAPATVHGALNSGMRAMREVCMNTRVDGSKVN